MIGWQPIAIALAERAGARAVNRQREDGCERQRIETVSRLEPASTDAGGWKEGHFQFCSTKAPVQTKDQTSLLRDAMNSAYEPSTSFRISHARPHLPVMRGVIDRRMLVNIRCTPAAHNNHHAFPGSAGLELTPSQPDPGWWTLRMLQALGLAWDIKLPADLPKRPELVALNLTTTQPVNLAVESPRTPA